MMILSKSDLVTVLSTMGSDFHFIPIKIFTISTGT